MKIVNAIKKTFGKSFCNICLAQGKIKQFDRLDLCPACFEKVTKIEDEKPFEISKENIVGFFKDEL